MASQGLAEDSKWPQLAFESPQTTFEWSYPTSERSDPASRKPGQPSERLASERPGLVWDSL